MQKPAKPIDESERLGALHDLEVLDTPLNPSYERIVRLTKTMFDVPIAAISLVDSDRQWFKAEEGLNVCQTGRDISFCGHAILQDDFFIVNDALQDERFADNPLVTEDPKIRFYAGFPIRDDKGYKLGSMCIMDIKPRNMSKQELEPLKDMAALVSQQLIVNKQKKYQSKMMQELDQAKREKMIDALTRVWNREGIELNFKNHAEQMKTEKNYIALAMIDIDDFKKINDTYGHNAGDYVLREVTKRILCGLDESDVLGRWGGEEFLGIIALKCDEPKACQDIFGKARENVCKTPIKYKDQDIHVTVSVGVTLSNKPGIDLEEVVEKADKALYQAKNSGKNKCVLEE